MAERGGRARGARGDARGRTLLGVLLMLAVVAAGYRAVHELSADGSTPASPATTSPASPGTPSATPTTASPTATTLGTPPITDVQLTTRSYRTGDCVTWDVGASTNRTSVVPCAQPHVVEVAGSVDLSGRFTTYPTPAEMDDLIEKDCTAIVAARLFPTGYDPEGRFRVGMVRPVPSSWANGDRTIWCGAEALPTTAPTRTDGTELFTGAVETSDQTPSWPIGTCFGSMNPWSVSCTTSHIYEITGTVDVSGRTEAPPSAIDDNGWDALIGADCRRLTASYLGGKTPFPDLETAWLAIPADSWKAGRRTALCTVGRYVRREPVAIDAPLRS